MSVHDCFQLGQEREDVYATTEHWDTGMQQKVGMHIENAFLCFKVKTSPQAQTDFPGGQANLTLQCNIQLTKIEISHQNTVCTFRTQFSTGKEENISYSVISYMPWRLKYQNVRMPDQHTIRNIIFKLKCDPSPVSRKSEVSDASQTWSLLLVSP